MGHTTVCVQLRVRVRYRSQYLSRNFARHRIHSACDSIWLSVLLHPILGRKVSVCVRVAAYPWNQRIRANRFRIGFLQSFAVSIDCHHSAFPSRQFLSVCGYGLTNRMDDIVSSFSMALGRQSSYSFHSDHTVKDTEAFKEYDVFGSVQNRAISLPIVECE